MIDELQTLEHNGTWELVPLPPEKSTIGCRWLYAIKVRSDCKIDCLKACLLPKDVLRFMALTRDTFSLVAKITSIRIFFAKVAILCQLYCHHKL